MSLSTLKDRLAASTEVFGKEMDDVDDFLVVYPKTLLQNGYRERVFGQMRQTRTLLEDALCLQFNRQVAVVICEEEGYLTERGLLGKAFRNLAFVQLDSARFSHFAGTLTHELAHVLSQQLKGFAPPVLREGLACYAAEVTDAAVRPMGMPLHFHLAWMLGAGLRPTLADLWERRDYGPEMYDLGWSLTTFLIEAHGQEAFYALYQSDVESPQKQTHEVYGRSCAKVEHEWYEHVRDAVDLDYRKISRMKRDDGWTCSQAAWVSAN